MATLHTTSLKLDAEIKARLRLLAERRRRSAHWLMREAITQYLEREERRERLRQEAFAAWADYQATGSTWQRTKWTHGLQHSNRAGRRNPRPRTVDPCRASFGRRRRCGIWCVCMASSRQRIQIPRGAPCE